MRNTVLVVAIATSILLDRFLFPLIGITRFAPDCLIALFVSMGVLRGLLPAVPVSVAVGLVIDICCNPFNGMSAIPLLLAAFAGSLFFSRFYADNVVIPALTAAVAAFIKELFLLTVLLLKGGRISGYFSLFVLHILPASLLTGALCALIHLVMKKYMPRDSLRMRFDRPR